MLWRCADRGWSIQYMEMGDLYLADGHPRANMQPLIVKRDPDDFYELGAPVGPIVNITRRHTHAQRPTV